MEHTLGIADVLSFLHRDAARSDGRVDVVGCFGDGLVRLEVDPTRYGVNPGTLIPDGTLIVRIDGEVQLLFLELMNQGAVTTPGTPQSVRRSFAAKLLRYKALARTLPENTELSALFEEFGLPVPRGLRVLVVSTRTEIHLAGLQRAAPAGTAMSYFTRLDRLTPEQTNAFLDPVWRSADGEARSLG